VFEKHLLLRNYLVGHNLTLADVYLYHAIIGSFKQLFEKKTRIDKLVNLTRFVSLNSESFFFQQGYGVVSLCKKQAKCPPPKPKEQAPVKDKAPQGEEKQEKKA
jgi:dihydroorotase